MEILRQPLAALPLSEDFVKRADAMGFTSLEDVLSMPPEVLRAQKNFNYLWLEELVGLLSRHGLSNKLQPLPGSNAR